MTFHVRGNRFFSSCVPLIASIELTNIPVIIVDDEDRDCDIVAPKRARGFSFDFQRDRAFSWDILTGDWGDSSEGGVASAVQVTKTKTYDSKECIASGSASTTELNDADRSTTNTVQSTSGKVGDSGSGSGSSNSSGSGSGSGSGNESSSRSRVNGNNSNTDSDALNLSKDSFHSPVIGSSQAATASSTVSPASPVPMRSRRNSLAIDIDGDGDLETFLRMGEDKGSAHDPNDAGSQQAYFASIFKSEDIDKWPSTSNARGRGESFGDYLYMIGPEDDADATALMSNGGGSGGGSKASGTKKKWTASSSSSSSNNANRGYVAGSSKSLVFTPEQQASYGASAVHVNADGHVCIGIYTRDERRQLIEKFRAKKQRRIWRKQIKYDCRKRLAETRPRVKGRFVSKKELAEGNWRLQPDGEWRDESQMTAEELAIRDADLAAVRATLGDPLASPGGSSSSASSTAASAFPSPLRL